MEAQEQKVAELTEKFNKRLDVVIKSNPNENFEIADRERSEEGLSNKLHQLRGSNHSLQNQAVDYLRHNILELRTEERNLEIAQGKNLGTLFISQDPFDNLLAIFQKLAERKKELNIEQTHIIGGKIKELAGKILSDPNFKYLFDEATQNTLQLYINNRSVEKIPLTSEDYYSLYSKWNEEIDNPTQMSKDLTKNEIEGKANEYHKKYLDILKQEKQFIKELANKVSTDYDFIYTLDEQIGYKIVKLINDDINSLNKNLTPQPLSSKDYLAISNRWSEEFNNPTELSSRMTNEQISEKVNEYYQKFQNALRNERKLKSKNMEKMEQEKIINTVFGDVSLTDIEMNRGNGYGQYKVDVTFEFENNRETITFHSTDSEKFDKYKEAEQNNRLDTAFKMFKNEIEYRIEDVINDIIVQKSWNNESTTAQEIFNEIQENFNPKEKAYLELKLINNIDGHHNMNMVEVANHLTSAEIENVHQYISKLEDKHYKPIIDSEGWSEDKNYNKLISDVVNIMENNKDFLNDINPVFLEVSQNTQKKREQFNIVEHLNTQMKYLGFGDTHKEEIKKGIESEDTSFQIHTTSDKVMEGNKVNFSVNFNKTEQGGVFLNSFNAKLTTEQGEERSHNFRINFTAKEAINLLEGRAVKTELSNKEGEKYQAFVKLNFEEEKTEKGNYKFQIFNENYGVNTLDILSKGGVKFNNLEHRDYLIKSLEKGNIINAKFEHDGKEIQGKAILNPQYKTLNLYDKDMNRINTNKPLQGLEQDNSQDKKNVKEQSISRSL